MKRLLTGLVVAIFLAGSLYAQDGKLDRFLDGKVKGHKEEKARLGDKGGGKSESKGKEKVRVILKVLPSLNAAAAAEAAKLGGKELRRFNVLSGRVVEMTVESLEALSKHPGVHSI